MRFYMIFNSKENIFLLSLSLSHWLTHIPTKSVNQSTKQSIRTSIFEWAFYMLHSVVLCVSQAIYVVRASMTLFLLCVWMLKLQSWVCRAHMTTHHHAQFERCHDSNPCPLEWTQFCSNFPILWFFPSLSWLLMIHLMQSCSMCVLTVFWPASWPKILFGFGYWYLEYN